MIPPVAQSVAAEGKALDKLDFSADGLKTIDGYAVARISLWPRSAELR